MGVAKAVMSPVIIDTIADQINLEIQKTISDGIENGLNRIEQLIKNNNRIVENLNIRIIENQDQLESKLESKTS
jgi:hypothetical protein